MTFYRDAKNKMDVTGRAIIFLTDRRVSEKASCQAGQLGAPPCESHPTMWVRVDDVEMVFCYHHLSELYTASLHRKRRRRPETSS